MTVSTVSPSFRGSAGSFFFLVLRNLLLTLLTLGIYYPWARNERRRFIVQNTWLGEVPLRYHGTGRELFIGYLKVLVAYGLFASLHMVAVAFGSVVGTLLQSAFLVLVIFVVIPTAIHGSQSYLMGRISWSEIRFAFSTSRRRFVAEYAKGLLLSLVTFGLYFPFFKYELVKIMSKAYALGDTRFAFHGSRRESVILSYRNFVLCIVTFGLFLPWAIVSRSRYFWSNVSFQGVRFSYRLTGLDLLALILLQAFAIPLSLGLLFPWVQTYSLRVQLGAIEANGEVDCETICGLKHDETIPSDALADVLDLQWGV